jgi:hypothetical protein
MRGLTCRVEQADGVAMHEVERPYGLIVGGDGGGCCAGQAMSLASSVMCWLRAFDSSDINSRRYK